MPGPNVDTPPAIEFADYQRICRAQDDYTALLDKGPRDRWLALFTEDATLSVGERAFAGHDGLREFLAARKPHAGKHVTSAPLIVAGDEDGLRVEANFIALRRGEDGALLVSGTGRYHDEFRRVDGTWRIASRRVELGAR